MKPTQKQLLTTIPNMPTIPETLKGYEQILLKNQRSYCDSTPLDDYLFKLAKSIIKHLRPLEDIVGVQALEKPTGKAYFLNYDHDYNELRVLSEEVTASTLRLNVKYDKAKSIDTIGQEIAHELISGQLSKIETLVDTKEIDLSRLWRPPDAAGLAAQSFADLPITLLCNINYHATQIAQYTRRGCGNFAIINEGVFDILKNSPAKLSNEHGFIGNRIQKVGMWNHMQFFLDTLDTQKDVGNVLVGYKGPSNKYIGATDAGIFYIPFLPVLVTEPIQFMTREASFCVNNAAEYYSKFTFKI